MQSTDRAGLPTNQVMALFADGSNSFSLSKGATFADLADRLDHLGERHIGRPTAIYLKVAAPDFYPLTRIWYLGAFQRRKHPALWDFVALLTQINAQFSITIIKRN